MQRNGFPSWNKSNWLLTQFPLYYAIQRAFKNVKRSIQSKDQTHKSLKRSILVGRYG